MRRRLAWLVALPLSLLGTELAHAAANTLFGAPAGARGELFQGGGPGAELAPALIAIAIAVVLAVAGGRAAGVWWSPRRTAVSLVPFACLAPLLFAIQEHIELAMHTGAVPVDAALDPSFAPGLLLQLPFALASYFVARLLLRVADQVGSWLRAQIAGLPVSPVHERRGWSHESELRAHRPVRAFSGRAPPGGLLVAPS